MSLKPLKKSDLEKDWMKTRRDKAIRIQPEYHLIVTEGTKTEPQYFQAVRDIINRQYRGIFLEKETIHLACLRKRKVEYPKMQMDISMYGLYMILTIFQQIISTGRRNFALRTVLMIYNTMRFGQINV